MIPDPFNQLLEIKFQAHSNLIDIIQSYASASWLKVDLSVGASSTQIYIKAGHVTMEKVVLVSQKKKQQTVTVNRSQDPSKNV